MTTLAEVIRASSQPWPNRSAKENTSPRTTAANCIDIKLGSTARAEAFVRARVKNFCEEMDRLAEWSSHVANEVVEFIRVDSPLLWQQPPCDVLNVKNGILNLETKRLEKHNADHLSAIQLPAKFDPTATCPKIDRFIAETFPEDAATLGYEIPAWLMTPDTSIQKAILLIGPGGNGKSRYLRMVEAFLGKISVSNLSLHRLESDKFACARLYGKLANICPDLPTEHLAGTSIFKAITGGDPITGEYKFKDSFDFVPFARLVFSANSPPRAHDASEGFFDRWLVIPFERRFRGEGGEIPADKLDAMLSEPAEQSGLLNRALDVLSRLRAAGRFFTSESVAKAFSEFHAATDPLTVWLDGQTMESPRALTTKRGLFRRSMSIAIETAGRPCLRKRSGRRSNVCDQMSQMLSAPYPAKSSGVTSASASRAMRRMAGMISQIRRSAHRLKMHHAFHAIHSIRPL